MKHKDKLVEKKVTGATFTTLILIACSDPDAVCFFPWKEEAFVLDYEALPNQDCMQVAGEVDMLDKCRSCDALVPVAPRSRC